MKQVSTAAINTLRNDARTVVRELGLLNDAYFSIGVTLAERHLLIELSTCLYPTMGEVAERLLLDKSTVSRLITQAAKKGFIECLQDEKDKRRRFIQLTTKGKKVLHEFEPIAFNQTRDALDTLTPEEIEKVYAGVALYARGLRRSRLWKQLSIVKLSERDNAELAHLVNQTNKTREWHDFFATYKQKGFSYFVVKFNEKIIGGVGISPFNAKNEKICQLERIYLHREMLDLECEQPLLALSITEAKKLGYQQCYVDVKKELFISTQSLCQQGFQIVKNSQEKVTLWRKTC